jgi:hypothetical protein
VTTALLKASTPTMTSSMNIVDETNSVDNKIGDGIDGQEIEYNVYHVSHATMKTTKTKTTKKITVYIQ